MSSMQGHNQEHLDLLYLYALQSLQSNEIPAAEAQISACAACRQELEAMRPVVQTFVSWPTDILRPASSLWTRLANRIAAESGRKPLSLLPPSANQPEWEEAAPGISVRLLATDTKKNRVSMLVR